jgi:hypothetical protein
MQNEPNWREFYITLGQLGPEMITGEIHYEIIDFIKISASETDCFWTELLQVTLFKNWGNPQAAVEKTIKVWAHNIREYMIEYAEPMSCMAETYIEDKTIDYLSLFHQSIENMRLELNPEIVVQLVAAASLPETE